MTPTLRWMAPPLGAAAFFTEAGVGIGVLSATRINETRHFASAFQFTEHFGLGLAFGIHDIQPSRRTRASPVTASSLRRKYLPNKKAPPKRGFFLWIPTR